MSVANLDSAIRASLVVCAPSLSGSKRRMPIMKKNNFSSTVRTSLVFSLVLSLCLGIVIADNPLVEWRAAASPGGKSKPAQGAKKVSPELQGKNGSGARARVILQLNGKPSGQLNALLNRNGVHVRAAFRNFNAQVVELPESLVGELAAFPEVNYVSVDRETQPLGHVSYTTGSDAVRRQTTLLGGNYTLDGTGIGIAVLDSGIDTTHNAFLGHNGNVRVVANQDFTGEAHTDDPYRHGTHIAGIATGNGRISNAKYIGIAPNAHTLSLRVLNSQPTGTISSVLAALNWLM